MKRLLTHPLVPLTVLTVFHGLLFAGYVVAGATPSATFELVAAFGWTVLLALWIVADARRRKCVPCFDFGLFCYLFLPIAAPGYCFWSRGARGTLMILALVLLWLAPYLLAIAVWLLLYG
jgi:hypothetical protein